MKTVNIYTDGACSGNQNENNAGGWGCVLQYGEFEKELCGGEFNTTNNRMELTALISALSALREKGLNINVFSDSSYLINCFKQHWIDNWRQNGWKTAAKKDVENKELWLKLCELMEGQKLSFYLVKGHLDLKSEAKLKAAYAQFTGHNGNDYTYEDFVKIAEFNCRCDELATRFQRENKND